MSTRTVRTTLALPADLLAAVDQAVQAGHARSRNEFVARALQRELAAQQRAAIDAAFAAIAEDFAYHTEAQALTEAFRAAWDALRLAEGTTVLYPRTFSTDLNVLFCKTTNQLHPVRQL